MMLTILLFMALFISAYVLASNILWYIDKYRKPLVVSPLMGLVIGYAGALAMFLGYEYTVVEQIDPYCLKETDYNVVILSSTVFLINLISLMMGKVS